MKPQSGPLRRKSARIRGADDGAKLAILPATRHRMPEPGNRMTMAMNRFEGPGARPAKIRYLDGDFQVLMPGTHVICAVTGEIIPIDELKYWSVARQEPYVDVKASYQADKRAGVLPTDQ